MKVIVLNGSIVSGVGKGTLAASINYLMKMRGLKTEMIKFEPYRNLTASTLNPCEHGNVVVLDDGQECDLDMTHYSSLGLANLSSKNIVTSGQIYKELIDSETNGKWLGQTIQDIHVTEKINEKLLDLGKDVDLVICEIGGVCDDNEAWIYYNAIRALKQQLGSDNVLIFHVSYILYMNVIQEFKTRPLQAGIKSLRSFGYDVDVLFCRSEKNIPENIIDKISKTTGLSKEIIFSCPDVETIYQIPINLYDLHIDDLIAEKFRFKRTNVKIHKYRDLVEKYLALDDKQSIEIAIVGKYTEVKDSYFTVKEALNHAGVANNVKINIKWVNSEGIKNEDDAAEQLKTSDGILIPGGFGGRAIEGMVQVSRYARRNKVCLYGICLGMQICAIDVARECGLDKANSMEFDPKTKHPVVHYIDGQEKIVKKSGTMRLGAYDLTIERNSIAHDAYQLTDTTEIHRHRLELNKQYEEMYEKFGFHISGRNPQSGLVEIMELDKEIHPFFLANQFHSEFRSRLVSPHPLFVAFVKKTVKRKKKNSKV